MKLEVYKITNQKNGKIYIGITNQGAQTRWLHHLYESRSGSSFPLHNSIRKHGVENFQIEVIEVITEDHDYDYLKEREIYWIKFYDSYNREKGYNLTLGGDGTFGRFHSEETKDKIRKKALGRKKSDETKSRISISHKKRVHDHNEMSNRAKLGNSIRWSNDSERLKQSYNNPNNRIILKVDLNNNIIEEYRSISEAARQNNCTRQQISSCVCGKAKTVYGFIWKYKEQIYKPLINEEYDSNITTNQKRKLVRAYKI